MTASAPHHTPAPERAGREREAWDAYRASLRDLEGRDYEEVERASWSSCSARWPTLEDGARS